MDAFTDLSQLSHDDCQRLREILDAFGAACQDAETSAENVQLADYLPPVDDPLRLAALRQLIIPDLQRRWGRGDSVWLEEYLQTFPELGDIRKLPTQLIFGELCVRQRYDETVDVAEYQDRFPSQFADLQQLLGETGAPGGTLVLPPAGPSVNESPVAANSATPKPSSTVGDEGGRTAALSNDPQRVIAVGGGYRLMRLIGRGQFGEVWLAEAPGGVEVAVKIIRFPIGHKMSQQELRALELMKHLRHTFLLQVQAYWVMEDHLVIVMELADESLAEVFKRCQDDGTPGIPQAEMLCYMRETAEAMDYLHSEHVLHRDIKPANILLIKGHAKVGDFGLARVLMRDELSVTATSIGTPLYMAPEVWKGKAGPRSDQYSLAVTYAELRAGRPPFPGNSMMEVMQDHLRRQPELELLEEKEQRVLCKALAKKPEDRFASCTEFAHALTEATTRERPAKAPPARPRRLLMKLLLLLLAAVLVWYVVLQGMGPFGSPLAIDAPAEVSVTAGERLEFHISIRRPSPQDKVDLQFRVQPDSKRVDLEWEPAEDGAQVTATVPVDVAAGVAEIVVSAVSGRRRVTDRVLLHIEAANYEMPPDCEPAEEAMLVSVAGKNYYERVVRVLPSGTRVEFVLVPRGRPSDPPTFYVMKNKVRNSLFSEFASAHPEKLSLDSQWQKGARLGGSDLGVADHPDLPVLRVAVEEAYHFALWVGGFLPTVRQWDKAAGRFDPAPAAEGPFEGIWNPADRSRVAVNRTNDGPLPVGTAFGDISPFGCRDMAGNGREWTRNVALSDRTIPLEQPGQLDGVTLRGRSYTAPEPLTYRDLADDSTIETAIYDSVSPLTGFRVVLEPVPGIFRDQPCVESHGRQIK